MMYRHEKVKIHRQTGECVEAIAPIIVSASRSTDIPAFHSDWFFNRLKSGYCGWRNPFNQQESFVSFAKTRCVVFWSKNPAPLLDKLHLLKERDIHSYVQFTLNHYKAEGFEPAVPGLAQRIDTFKRLVDALGVGAVIWRYDPIILTDKLQIDDHLGRILAISDMLKGYCEKLVFSFADIAGYRKVQYNMNQYKVAYEDFTPEKMAQFAKGLKEINSTMGLELATCGEQIDLSSYGIEKNRCIDPDLIAHLFHDDKKLMYWLGYDDMFGAPTTFPKDSGQRAACGCILSKDIGAYTTCGHGCLYCYANTTPALGKFGCERAISEPLRESLGNL